MRDRRRPSSERVPFATLGRPWFLACLSVLVANDHFLKWRFPGPVTGKISDFAGPVVVATVTAVVLGRTKALSLTVVGFVALKTVPGVAEWAEPVLGGVTRRDPTDVIGLVTMPWLWHRLGRCHVDAEPSAASASLPVRAVTRPVLGESIRSRFLPFGGAALALMALTATSPVVREEVDALLISGSTIYASVVANDSDDEPYEWATSTDGGLTWERLEGEPPSSAEPVGSHGCRRDGQCFTANLSHIAETSPGGEPETSYRLNGTQRGVLDYRRFDAGARPDDMFDRVAIVPVPAGDSVVVSARDQGVVVLPPDSGWKRVGVLSVDPTPIGGSMFPLEVATMIMFFSLPVTLAVAVFRALDSGGRGGWAKAGSIIGALVLAGFFWAAGVVAWAIGNFNRVNPMALAAVLAASAVATVIVPFEMMRPAPAPRSTPGPQPGPRGDGTAPDQGTAAN